MWNCVGNSHTPLLATHIRTMCAARGIFAVHMNGGKRAEDIDGQFGESKSGSFNFSSLAQLFFWLFYLEKKR